mmetsp:Transcript_58198/g.127260  ORF Transcript_58198/g.127260 Transcript_58198/m.127260 type:complete len:346 (-) Transcript_58198:24-1061(-)
MRWCLLGDVADTRILHLVDHSRSLAPFLRFAKFCAGLRFLQPRSAKLLQLFTSLLQLQLRSSKGPQLFAALLQLQLCGLQLLLCLLQLRQHLWLLALGCLRHCLLQLLWLPLLLQLLTCLLHLLQMSPFFLQLPLQLCQLLCLLLSRSCRLQLLSLCGSHLFSQILHLNLQILLLLLQSCHVLVGDSLGRLFLCRSQELFSDLALQAKELHQKRLSAHSITRSLGELFTSDARQLLPFLPCGFGNGCKLGLCLLKVGLELSGNHLRLGMPRLGLLKFLRHLPFQCLAGRAHLLHLRPQADLLDVQLTLTLCQGSLLFLLLTALSPRYLRLFNGRNFRYLHRQEVL